MNSAELQKSIYGVLVGDGPLVASLSSAWGYDAVFSDVPQENADDNAFYPFISFGPDTTTPWDTKGSSGGESVLDLSVWSRSGDYIEAKEIAGQVWDLLHRTEYAISGSTLVTSDIESSVASIDPDGETRRVLMQLRVIYENT